MPTTVSHPSSASSRFTMGGTTSCRSIFNMGLGAQRSFRQTVEGALGFSEMVAYWNPIFRTGPMREATTLCQECTVCEHDGQLCALNLQTNQTFCAHGTAPHSLVIYGESIDVFFSLVVSLLLLQDNFNSYNKRK